MLLCELFERIIRDMQRNRLMVRSLKALMFLLLLLVAGVHAGSLAEELIAKAPSANPEVVRLAVKAAQCAASRGEGSSDIITLIDYSIDSTMPRLWVFDTVNKALVYEEWVAHGKNSGENSTKNFSNEHRSYATSLGLFKTADSYYGKNGYSLRLHGLESGVNDKAFERAIVMHGAPYVSETAINNWGRLGRSWGCPAVRSEIAAELIDTIKDGYFIFSYYPDSEWLEHSKYLNCAP